MDEKEKIGEQELQLLLQSAQIGWWKADFGNKAYICSEFIIELLNLQSEVLPFWDFFYYIREDYRARITNEFASIKDQVVYEQTFPINTRFGEKWVHSKLFRKEIQAGKLIGWGFLQCIDNPKTKKENTSLRKVNDLLYQQHSISRSLLTFMKTEDIHNVIYKILEDILLQYKGSRVYIFEYDDQRQVQNCTFEVVADGICPQKNNLQNIKWIDTPWCSHTLQKNNPIILNNLEELPEEASLEKEILQQQNIKSLMIVPMAARNAIRGYLGIDIVDSFRNWKNEDYQWLNSLANIISLCIELRKSENEVRIEKEYFRNLYEHMPVGYIRLKLLYDSHRKLSDYRFVDLNPAFQQLTGTSSEIFLHRKGSECENTFPIPISLENIRQISRQTGYQQFTFQNKARTLYFRVLTYAAEKDEIVYLFSDVTEIFKAHKALDRSEKTLRNLFTNIPVGIEIYDKNGILVDINDKDLTTFGLQDKHKALGVNLFDNPHFPEPLRTQLREKKDVDFELNYDFTQNGQSSPTERKNIKNLLVRARPLYDENGNFENYLLIVIDNTETLSAYNRIRNFENLFSLIAEFAKIGYFKWNPYTREGFAIHQWYKNLEEDENTPLENIIGIYPHLHPEDAPLIRKSYQELIQGKISRLKQEIRVATPEGGWKWLRCNITTQTFDPQHQNVELIGVNFDITEMKQIEAQLTEAKNKAETLDKLKSAFLANMSHEIRTPLNAIVGFSNLLSDTTDPEERKQYVDIIQKNNDLLLQLISDILDLSKMESGTFEFSYGDVEVYQLCHEILCTLSVKAPEQVEIRLSPDLPACHLKSDKNRLTQILTNFINNALKFTHAGTITLGYKIDREEIEFYVSDTGIGIPQEKLSHIFDRFVKLNNFIHGTGLGLSICKSLVEQMDGKIGVESEEGKGSRFWFRLPYTPSVAACVTVSSSPTGSGLAPVHSNHKRLRILIAEDTDSNYILLSSLLKKSYEIIRALNGKEAVEKFETQSPDLILMDIKMPVMDGLQATRLIRKTDPHIPIIALTAFAFESDKQQSFRAGCNDYLTKPLSSQQLKDTLQKYLT